MQLNFETLMANPSVAPTEAARVSIYRSLADLPGDYSYLFAENAAYSFFCSLPWFLNFCKTALNPRDEIRIFAIEVGNEPRPSLALITRYNRSSNWGLRPQTLSSLSNYYTPFYLPLYSHSQYSPSLLEILARAICTDRPGWDVVDLKWLDPEAPLFSEMQRAFRSAGMIVQSYFCAGNWYLPVNSRSYREYFESLRSSVRNIARSKNKKIERSGRARVEIVTGSTGLEAAIHAYERIYASSWKVPEPYPQFVPGLIRTCASEGCLRLGTVYIDGDPAASQVWITTNGKASIYKIAYDRRFTDLSVGTFLTTRMMEYALDVDKVSEVDYLTGDDSYKKDWMSHRRERWGLLAINPYTPRGALAIARHIGGRAVKRAAVSLCLWH